MNGFISELKIKQIKKTVAHLELFEKAENDALKIFIKELVGEERYNQKVNEIYQISLDKNAEALESI